jgi:hypothetical protein
MQLRERRNEMDEGGAPGDENMRAGADLARLRETVGDFLDAGHAAIERALSGDSESFLRASRQRGGE